ncbi:asparaginase domain-containing protein [Hydrocarboniphaga effusa]|uniref:asparaginase domain-containing protein n=1 Tax=Hydrocarboniphaga effusa TaxID=243629 RepID=UPI00398BF170
MNPDEHKMPTLLCIAAMLSVFSLDAYGAEAQAPAKPKIAIFSGPTATIQNNEPFVTSIKAREKYGLPGLIDAHGHEANVDVLRPQRLAAPVKVYVEQFSAHPLERDVAELYGPPDGYLDTSGAFSKERRSPEDKAVYEVELKPEDGLYPLPYMARQVDGSAWDSNATKPGAPFAKSRQTFYPDASRIFEEIEREGANLQALASFDFYRAAPSGGYTKGLKAAQRTDVGSGDIAPEKPGVDFFQYGAYGTSPTRAALAKATNVVQSAMGSGDYAGGIWFEGSPNIEDSAYWMNLLIDTPQPLVFNAAQRTRGKISPDGDANIINSVEYIVSDVWKDAQGHNQLGAIAIQDDVLYTAREVTKGDARPGGYVPTGGFGGYLGDTDPLTVAYVPNRLHTYRSEVRSTLIPAKVKGIQRNPRGGVKVIDVALKNAKGELLPTAIPNVVIVKGSRWSIVDESRKADAAVDVLAQIDQALDGEPLSGIAAEGNQGGSFVPAYDAAFALAAASGIPVVKVSRGPTIGYLASNPDNLFIEGSNLSSTKARMLLMACLMRFGALPAAADPYKPTEAELKAIKARIAEYQRVFDTH